MRYRFGAYTLDTQCYELWQDGQRVPLRPKVWQVLTYLLEHRDTVVSKDALIAAIWPGQAISDETLSTCITAARRAVGDSGQAQQVIQTRHRYGYRFVAPVTRCDGPPTDPMARAAVPTDASGEPGQERPCRVEGVAASAASMVALPPPPSPHLPGSLGGEQKLVTVLVCQLVPLAPLPSGPPRQAAEIQHQAMQTLCALAVEAIEGYEGTLQAVQEEGCLILFGAPVAQEDHARRAVRAAWGLQERCQRVPLDPAWPSRAPYTVRLGVHTGQLLLGSLGADPRLTYTAVGDTTQQAAWLAQQAAPGTILVSDATARLVESSVCPPPLPRADRSTCRLSGTRARHPPCSPAE